MWNIGAIANSRFSGQNVVNSARNFLYQSNSLKGTVNDEKSCPSSVSRVWSNSSLTLELKVVEEEMKLNNEEIRQKLNAIQRIFYKTNETTKEN